MENGQEIRKHINQTDLISCAKELLQTNDVALVSVLAWLLGQLYSSSFEVTDAKSSGMLSKQSNIWNDKKMETLKVDITAPV